MLIGVAGILGTLARYGLIVIVNKYFGGILPWGTFVVNMVGCFVAGFLWVASERYVHFSTEALAIILIGFVGAFTTFSTFILETVALIRASQWGLASINMLIHNVIGIAALFAGLSSARLIFK
jgi:CrcB protein